MVKITSSERVGSARPPGPQPKAERGLASRGTRFIRDPARFCAEQPKFWTPPPGSPLRGSPIVEEPKGWGPLPFFHPGLQRSFRGNATFPRFALALYL